MRFEFISVEKAHFPVNALCRVLNVSKSGYYAWCNRKPSKRTLDDAALLRVIRSVFSANRKTYGSPRVHAVLLDQGIEVGENRVARIMRENGIAVQTRRGFRCSTTQSDPNNAVVGNELDRDFTATAINEKWVTDVTFVPTNEGWLYLASILDLYNREVIGWAMSDRNDETLTLNALDMALETNKPAAGLVHHSDRGSNYTSTNYCKALTKRGIKLSMSRRGNCWDNAVAESFFATIKKELIHQLKFSTRREAAAAIFEYIEVFYNRIRKHSQLGYTSPVEFKRDNDSAALAA